MKDTVVVVGGVAKTGEAESHMVSYFNMCDRKYGQMGGGVGTFIHATVCRGSTYIS